MKAAVDDYHGESTIPDCSVSEQAESISVPQAWPLEMLFATMVSMSLLQTQARSK